MFLNSILLQVSGDTEYLAKELTTSITNSSNSNNWIQVFLALAVIATVFITLYYNKKTHNQTEREMKVRFRPIFARLHDMKKKKVSGDKYSGFEGESYTINQEKLTIHLINNGTLPANSISYRYYVELRDGNMVSHKKVSEEIHLPDMSPHEHYSIDIPWNQAHFYEATEGGNCYFGLEIKYGSNDISESYVYAFDGYLKDKYLMIEKSNIT